MDLQPPFNPTDRAADVAYCRRVLLRLIEVSADVVEVEHAKLRAQADRAAQGVDPEPAAAAANGTVAIDRMSRAIRRDMAMLLRLHEPVTAAKALDGRVAARRTVMREVEDVIGRDAENADDDAALRYELYERMDAPELDAEIDARGPEDIILELCRDLGIGWMPGTPLYRRRTPDDVAALWARSARPLRGMMRSLAGQPACGAADDG